MSQHYSDPSRESDPYALPDLEIFWQDGLEDIYEGSGYYYWFCFTGCLPDSAPVGPFDTRDEALAHARENANLTEDER